MPSMVITRGPRDIAELDLWFVLSGEGDVTEHPTIMTAAQQMLSSGMARTEIARSFVHWSLLDDDERSAIWDAVLAVGV